MSEFSKLPLVAKGPDSARSQGAAEQQNVNELTMPTVEGVTRGARHNAFGMAGGVLGSFVNGVAGLAKEVFADTPSSSLEDCGVHLGHTTGIDEGRLTRPGMSVEECRDVPPTLIGPDSSATIIQIMADRTKK